MQGSSTIMEKKEICYEVAIKFVSVDLNEAQKGKDKFDCDGAVQREKFALV